MVAVHTGVQCREEVSKVSKAGHLRSNEFHIDESTGLRALIDAAVSGSVRLCQGER